MEDEKQETENPSNNLLIDSPFVAERTETSTARNKVTINKKLNTQMVF